MANANTASHPCSAQLDGRAARKSRVSQCGNAGEFDVKFYVNSRALTHGHINCNRLRVKWFEFASSV